MKVYRFMSVEEFRLFNCHLELTSNSRHSGKKTDSEGFCFLPEVVNFTTSNGTFNWSPLQCYQFMSGIVSGDVLCEFETHETLEEGFGIYAEPFSGIYGETMAIRELSISSYSSETFSLLRYTTDIDWSRKAKWY